MSLVNQVLNDLEKRGVNVAQADAALRAVPSRKRVNWLPYVLAALLLTGALAAAKWFAARETVVAVEPLATAGKAQFELVPGISDAASAPLQVSQVAAAEPLPQVAEQTAVEERTKTAPRAAGKKRSDAVMAQSEAAEIPPGAPLKVVTPQQRAESEYNKANQYVREGRTDEALAAYESALLSDSNYKAARRGWVALLLNLKRNSDAERVLQRGLKRDPHDAAFAMLLARLQVERNAIPEAMQTLQKNLADAADQPDYQAFMAALLQRQERHQEAIPLFQKALALSPNNGVWMMGLGISLQAEQRKDDARAAYQRALDSKTLNPQLQEFVQQKLKEL